MPYSELEQYVIDDYCAAVQQGDTAAGVLYSWGLAGPDGAHFVLYKTPSITPDQIREAKRILRRDNDVVWITVRVVPKRYFEETP